MSLDSVFLCHISFTPMSMKEAKRVEWKKIRGSKKINLRKRVTLETNGRGERGLERQQFVPLCVRHIYGALLMV